MDLRGPVLVVGDVLLDVVHAGAVERISPEAPLPVLHCREPGESSLGGAGAVARILRGLGVQVGLLAGLGADRAADRCRALAREAGIAARWATVPWPTPAKHRFCDERGRQLGLRWDFEAPPPLRPERDGLPCLPAVLERAAQSARAIVLADYGKGFLCDGLLRAVMTIARRQSLPVLVDPARGRRWHSYAGAAVIKANAAEYAAAGGVEGLPADTRVVVTQGNRGISWRQVEGDPPHVTWPELPAPPELVARAIDPTGCGDTVAAVLGALLASGQLSGSARDPAAWPAALHLANVAGGLQAGRPGVATIGRAELLEAARSAGLPRGKICEAGPQLAELAARLRATGRQPSLVNGCFAALHAGHVRLLECARRADPTAPLFVGINSAESVARLKGPRPTIDDATRLRLLAALPTVDAVVLQRADDAAELIEQLQPRYLFKGPTSAALPAAEAAALDRVAGRAVVLQQSLVEGCATRDLAAAAD